MSSRKRGPLSVRLTVEDVVLCTLLQEKIVALPIASNRYRGSEKRLECLVFILTITVDDVNFYGTEPDIS